MQVIRKYKLWCLFAIVLFAGFATVVLETAASRDNSTGPPRPIVPRQQPDAAHRTRILLAGIPQHGSLLGRPDAPVTLQFFGDLQCRDSRQVMLGALPFLIRRWVRTGKLRIRFRALETDTFKAGGFSEFAEQQGAALAAGNEGKLWNFVDAFYREQGPEFTGYVDRAFLDRIAKEAGLEIPFWEREREPGLWELRLLGERLKANHAGVYVTPAFLIGRTGSKPRLLRHFGLEEPRVFDEAIKELL